MGLVIGEKYEVACAELRWREDGRTYHVPIFDHYHADPQFGFPDHHYHIDARFEMEPRMRHYLKLNEGQTSSVIVLSCEIYELAGIVKRTLSCVSTSTGLRIPESGDNALLYDQWYQSFIGRSCAGKKCPHFGAEMLERDGWLVCPMHGLTADLVNLQITPRSTDA